MTTVLGIAQTAMYQLKRQAPSALFGETSDDALHILHLIYDVSRELRNLCVFPQQKKLHSFATTADRFEYPLPNDFYSHTQRTQFNTDSRRRLNGPISDSEFTLLQYGGVDNSYEISYRTFGPDGNEYTAGGQFQIRPTPSSAINIKFEYVTKNLFIPKYWLPSTDYTEDVYVSSNGNIYLCDTTGTSDSATPPDGTTQDITDGTTRWDYQDIVYETILADTDLSLFDDDIMIAGLKYKYLDSLDLPRAETMKMDYERLKNRAKTRWQGSFIGSFAGRNEDSRRYRPSTDGSW